MSGWKQAASCSPAVKESPLLLLLRGRKGARGHPHHLQQSETACIRVSLSENSGTVDHSLVFSLPIPLFTHLKRNPQPCFGTISWKEGAWRAAPVCLWKEGALRAPNFPHPSLQLGPSVIPKPGLSLSSSWPPVPVRPDPVVFCW